jgi:serine O-acetyltransferase
MNAGVGIETAVKGVMVQAPWHADLLANTGNSGFRSAMISMITSPGFAVITWWRFAQWLRFSSRWQNARWARAVTWLVVRSLVRRGCYISLLADIGPGLKLPHPIGIVIGEGISIGGSVTLYHNVTLGRRAWDEPSYPSIEDNVVVYPGAVIIGSIKIGESATIAANSVVNRDVPPKVVVAGIPARPIRSLGPSSI